ncbi:RluA family pseudouridine synthase [Patescibacteria group bacterium]
MEPLIIHETADYIIIDKPSGWITNSASTTKGQPVVQDWLYDNFEYPIAKDKESRSGVVHRLDKETSGALIIAKTQNVFVYLQKQFKNRKVKKTYTLLAHGVVDPEVGNIVVPVGRLPWRKDRFGVLPGGRSAKTDYKVNEMYEKEGEKFSLLDAYPATGRTHQLRIHFKHIGHPIVSDEFYAGRKTARSDRLWCPRLFLHAGSISFTDVSTSKKVIFSTDLPADLTKALKTINKI